MVVNKILKIFLMEFRGVSAFCLAHFSSPSNDVQTHGLKRYTVHTTFGKQRRHAGLQPSRGFFLPILTDPTSASRGSVPPGRAPLLRVLRVAYQRLGSPLGLRMTSTKEKQAKLRSHASIAPRLGSSFISPITSLWCGTLLQFLIDLRPIPRP
jgi:hypothetical protein